MCEIKLQLSVDDIEANATMNDKEYNTIKEIGLDPIRLLVTKLCGSVNNDERFKDKGFTFDSF